MHYINPNRKLGLSGLMRVKSDAQTLACSIDSCIDALDELIITYNDCTDDSPRIIEEKRQQYPDKIIVIPYPHHIYGVDATKEEFEYAKTLPIGHPQLLASYYNNALQYVNYKYVLKIDADQIYFTQPLVRLRDYIVNGAGQKSLGRVLGKAVSVFCLRRGNRRIWSKWHPLHWLQYVVVPLFKEQFIKYAVTDLLKGNGYLSLSGVNVLRYNDQWYSPLANKIVGVSDDMVWPYSGFGDHLVFEATEETEYMPFEFRVLLSSEKRILMERLQYPPKNKYLVGFYWFHFKPMKSVNEQYITYLRKSPNNMLPVDQLGKVSFAYLSKYMDIDKESFWLQKRNFFNFLHNLDKKSIKANKNVLGPLTNVKWE